MTYTNDKTKRGRVLDALVTLLEGITQANGCFFDVKRVHLLSAWQTAFGKVYPAIAVVVSDDERVRSLACAADEYRMDVDIVGVIGVPSRSTEWVDEIHRLLGDIQQRLADDRQLGGLVSYIEVNSTDVSSLDTEGQGLTAVCAVSCSILYRVSVADVTV